jgi:serine/threonine protein phosphatase PrpC
VKNILHEQQQRKIKVLLENSRRKNRTTKMLLNTSNNNNNNTAEQQQQQNGAATSTPSLSSPITSPTTTTNIFIQHTTMSVTTTKNNNNNSTIITSSIITESSSNNSNTIFHSYTNHQRHQQQQQIKMPIRSISPINLPNENNNNTGDSTAATTTTTTNNLKTLINNKSLIETPIIENTNLPQPTFWEQTDASLEVKWISGLLWNPLLQSLSSLIAQSTAIRILYHKLRETQRKNNRIIEIPLVIDVDNRSIVAIGPAVSWPDGLAKQVVEGHTYSVVQAIFSKKSTSSSTNPLTNRNSKNNLSNTSNTTGKISMVDSNSSSTRHKHRTGFQPRLHIRYAIADAQGQRARMEDRFCASMNVSNKYPDIACVAIFDGHSGAEAATTAADSLIDELRKILDQETPTTEESTNINVPDLLHQSLIRVFERLEYIVSGSMQELKCHAGTTALVCIITKTTLLVANLGDSRAVLSHRNGTISPLTTDHKATLPAEIERVLRVPGAFIDSSGYVGGLLQVSRALGDLDSFVDEIIIASTSSISPGVGVIVTVDNTTHNNNSNIINNNNNNNGMEQNSTPMLIISNNNNSHNIDSSNSNSSTVTPTTTQSSSPSQTNGKKSSNQQQNPHKIKGVSAIPEISTRVLNREEDEFLVLACDGLWDVISNEGASEYARQMLIETRGDLKKSAQALVEFALERRSADNVTVAIISFRDKEFWKNGGIDINLMMQQQQQQFRNNTTTNNIISYSTTSSTTSVVSLSHITPSTPGIIQQRNNNSNNHPSGSMDSIIGGNNNNNGIGLITSSLSSETPTPSTSPSLATPSSVILHSRPRINKSGLTKLAQLMSET